MKWVKCTLLFLMLQVVPILAQTSSEPVVTVKSTPAGATVILSGALNIIGVTPTTFVQKLQGYYQVTAYRPGFETFRSSLVLSGTESTTLNIELSPKTRFKASIRSLLLPGWGQRYSGVKTKGLLITIGTIAAGITTGIFHLHYDNKHGDYDDVLYRYNATRKVSEREGMLDELYNAQKDANDAEELRNTGIGILIGIWVYSILDALLFFPGLWHCDIRRRAWRKTGIIV